ncbi:MAG: GAF domain-containing sensor histidine kinase [Polyangiaceae bacterium]|nr:GAF domain-containing sensor histidine kinase [Polyangiaceae bacterium]
MGELPRGPDSPSFLGARLRLARLDVGDEALLDRILDHAAKLTAMQLGVERVGIWLFDSERERLKQRFVYIHSLGLYDRQPIELEKHATPEYFKLLEEQRVLVIDDVKSHAATADIVESYLTPLGISSMLDAPIFRHGQIIGVVCHEHVGEERHWQSREVEFAASVADMVAIYFEQADVSRAQKLLHQRERELLTAERLASVGVLSRHVAHDLNNAVAPILMCAAQLRATSSENPSAVERIDIIQNAAEHGASLAKKLLAAAGGGTPIREPVDLDLLLRHAEPLLKTIAMPAELRLDLGATEVRIPADVTDLTRVVINLVTNARDAMPTGGVIVIRTAVEDSDLVFSVTDTGHGIDDLDKKRLFQPFFTTKPGRGTGLGLAGVHSVMESMRGRVDLYSQAGRGTVVTLTMPVVREVPTPPPPMVR